MPNNEYFKWAESLFASGNLNAKPEALKDVTVVELCTLILGPSVSSLLAEFGATVFKVELPGLGDTMRSITPFYKFYRGQAISYMKEARTPRLRSSARCIIAHSRGRGSISTYRRRRRSGDASTMGLPISTNSAKPFREWATSTWACFRTRILNAATAIRLLPRFPSRTSRRCAR